MAKYQEIYLQLASRIVNGELAAGEKLPSVAALAKQCNISYMTANKVYELLSRNLLVDSRPRQGFFVRAIAHSPSGCSSELAVGKVGLLLGMGNSVYSEFYNQLVMRLFNAGHAPLALGCSWMMQNMSSNDAKKQLQRYADAGVETLIIRGDAYFPYKALYELKDTFKKIIFVMYYSGEMAFKEADKVLFDMRGAGRIAAKHLLENRFNKFVFITQEPACESLRRKHGVGNKLFDLEMLDGIEDVCKDHGFDFYDHGVIIARNVPYSEPAGEVKKQVITAIKNGCNGFICLNDVRALEVYQAAAELGLKINKDIGVTGNFNTTICETLNPKLTSIDLNVSMLVEGVINAFGNNSKKQTVYITPELVK